MSLVEEAARRCDRMVASVFVNPTQFGPGEDLATYPRDFARDRALLEDHGCHLVFHPSVEEMYPAGATTFVEVCSEMPKQLCGKTRPIHFRGCARWWPSSSTSSPRTKPFSAGRTPSSC